MLMISMEIVRSAFPALICFSMEHVWHVPKALARSRQEVSVLLPHLAILLLMVVLLPQVEMWLRAAQKDW